MLAEDQSVPLSGVHCAVIGDVGPSLPYVQNSHILFGGSDSR